MIVEVREVLETGNGVSKKSVKSQDFKGHE